MADRAEIIWREALKTKGRDWVMGELRRRAGQAGDAMYDIVFEEPLPTRQFCEQWCAEEDNKMFRVSWHTKLAFILLILFVICSFRAVQSWNQPDPAQSPRSMSSGAVSSAAMPSASSSMTNDIPSMSPTPSASSSSGSTSSGSSTSSPSVCAYATYDTAQCKVQK
jgi:hypothetical protein